MDKSSSNTSAINPQIKFQEVLARLISESPYSTNRRAIWEHAGVSSAALSQYVLGHARPRFETLTLLAEFFGVTLDYLVLGKQMPTAMPDESQSMARYVDWTLADMQARTGAHTWLVTRVGQAVAGRIDEIARDILPEVPHVGGLLTDNDALRLERLSLHSKIVTVNLEYDLLNLDEQVVAGRFARVVAENLLKDQACTYQVLLPARSDVSWSDVIHSYRKVLASMGVPPERMRQYQLLRTDARVFSGGCFYQLDLVRFAREEPIMYEALRPYVSDRNWIGFNLHQNSETLGGLLYDPPNLDRALSAFDELWAEGTRIPISEQGKGD